MAGGTSRVDAKWLKVSGPQLVDSVAHGDELIRSARSLVLRVEEEQGAGLPSQVTQSHLSAARAPQSEIRRHLSELDHAHSFPPASMRAMPGAILLELPGSGAI